MVGVCALLVYVYGCVSVSVLSSLQLLVMSLFKPSFSRPLYPSSFSSCSDSSIAISDNLFLSCRLACIDKQNKMLSLPSSSSIARPHTKYLYQPNTNANRNKTKGERHRQAHTQADTQTHSEKVSTCLVGKFKNRKLHILLLASLPFFSICDHVYTTVLTNRHQLCLPAHFFSRLHCHINKKYASERRRRRKNRVSENSQGNIVEIPLYCPFKFDSVYIILSFSV